MTNMGPWTFYNQPTACIPFSLDGYPGQVTVYYAPDDDPTRVGYDFLAGVDFDANACCGYPLIHARIEKYEGAGIRAFMGWVQVVTGAGSYSHGPDQARPETSIFVDIPPAMGASGQPFYSFGCLPQLFDAPCRNLGSYAELRWTAETFLTTLPLRSRDEPIACLAGFRWGYVESDLAGQKPVLLPLEALGPQAWSDRLPFLRQQFEGWRFG